jgi:hypothetical protein
MTVSFLIDGRHVWTGRFTGTSDARMIEGDFSTPAEALDFVRAFAWGQRMTIRFLEGTEAPWSADLEHAVFTRKHSLSLRGSWRTRRG